MRKILVAAMLGSAMLVAACGSNVAEPRIGSITQSQVQGTGAITLTISEGFQRHLDAVNASSTASPLTTADIASYRITLSGANLASPLVANYPAPTPPNNQVSVHFEDLQPGQYTMTVEALDASGNVIGSGSQTGTVTAGLCTYIDIGIKLNDVHVTNPNGDLGARITVTNGNVITDPIASCSAQPGFVPLGSSPTPTAAPSAGPATLTFLDTNSDLMGNSTYGADGQPDGHFQLAVSASSSAPVEYISIEELGTNLFWTTENLSGTNAILGAYENGSALASAFTNSLVTLPAGTTTLDLYANNDPAGAQIFVSGATFLSEVHFTDGAIASGTTTLP